MSAPGREAAASNRDTRLMDLFVGHLLRVLESANTGDGPSDIPSATLSVIRQFLSDNSITISSVRRGDFGQVAKAAADDFPFNDDGTIRGDSMISSTAN